MIQLLSIQVGQPQERHEITPQGRDRQPWTSGIYKSPVEGRVKLSFLNLAGDGQADLSVHGGVHKAVLAYSADHYPYWRETLPVEMPYGVFGENFTLSGLTEETAFVGDVYQVGEAVVQVSQPRFPCWKLTRRVGVKDMAARVVATGYAGWYFRVLQEGYVEAGQPFTLLEHASDSWSIARVYRHTYEQV